jgi:hypothetical protein
MGVTIGRGGDGQRTDSCVLDVGELCIVGKPTDGGQELTEGMAMVFSLRPAGCFSTSCYELTQSNCNIIGSGQNFSVSGFVCVERDASTCKSGDCAAPAAVCDSGQKLTAGDYTVSVANGPSVSQLKFTVPSVLSDSDRCTHSLL